MAGQEGATRERVVALEVRSTLCLVLYRVVQCCVVSCCVVLCSVVYCE